MYGINTFKADYKKHSFDDRTFPPVMLEFIFPIIFINKHFQIASDLSIKIYLVLIKTVRNLLIMLSAATSSMEMARFREKQNSIIRLSNPVFIDGLIM